MSQVETLPAINAIDFATVVPRLHHETPTWPTNLNDIRVVPWNSHSVPSSTTTGSESHAQAGDTIFPSLSPLYNGHPDIHLRNGIMEATRLGADHEPDAEKAFFVADLSQVYNQHMRWKACLPEIQPFYAVKCNPDPYVIRLLAALGAGFDCASLNEISQVLDVGGIDSSRIIFANPCKAVSFIRNAANKGVDMLTFDNADELYKVARAHPRAKLVVRILTDDSKSLCAFGIKFGAPLHVVPSLLAKAKELNLDVVGVSFHVGSGCYDPSVYTDAIMRARKVFDMAEAIGYDFTLLDVGGGFEDALFEKAAMYLNEAIESYFADKKGKVKIIAEPGRFYVSKAFKLAAHIIARRAPLPDNANPAAAADVPQPAPAKDTGVANAEEDAEAPKVMYYINDGVYGAFNCILFDHQIIHPYVLSMGDSFHIPSTQPKHLASVWGPTCDSIDCVSPKTMLPTSLEVGDWLGFDNMGAYTVCAASRFNGFEVSKVVYTGGGGNEVREVLEEFAKEGFGI